MPYKRYLTRTRLKYCRQCCIEEFGADYGDYERYCTPEDNEEGYFARVKCDGCGWSLVNSRGKCISEFCSKQHGKLLYPTEEGVKIPIVQMTDETLHDTLAGLLQLFVHQTQGSLQAAINFTSRATELSDSENRMLIEHRDALRAPATAAVEAVPHFEDLLDEFLKRGLSFTQ